MKRLLSLLLAAALLIITPPAAMAFEPAGESLRIIYGYKDVSFGQVDFDLMLSGTLKFTAVRGEDGREVRVLWRVSDESVATVDENGLVTVLDDGSGSFNVSCYAQDDPGKSCSVQVNYSKKLHKLSLAHYTGYTVRGESIVSLSPRYISYRNESYTASNPQLYWEVVSGGEHAYFSNPASGTLCTNAVSRTETVRIRVSSPDNPSASAEMNISVTPVVRSVSIYKGELDISGQVINCHISTPVILRAVCSPAQFADIIKWSSSSSGVTVENGVVMAHGPGSAIITAACIDGSGKSATVTLNFVE